MPVFTVEDVAKHNSEKDCWIIIHGKVYKVTNYLDDHPGGVEIITDLAGQDSTEDFDDVGHSEEAYEQLKDFYIGDVGKVSSGTATADSVSTAASTEGNENDDIVETVTIKETKEVKTMKDNKVMEVQKKTVEVRDQVVHHAKVNKPSEIETYKPTQRQTDGDQKSNNTLLYLGAAAAVVVVGYLVLRKRK